MENNIKTIYIILNELQSLSLQVHYKLFKQKYDYTETITLQPSILMSTLKIP